MEGKMTKGSVRRVEEGNDQCTSYGILQTPYNEVEEVPPYAGIMFEVYSKADPLEILTFEFNMRIANATSMEVEIYTLKGPFKFDFANQTAWTLLAKSTVVPAPEGTGGVIVPMLEFNPVTMQPRERRSFYITMKGPYIDHTVDALQKTGELSMRGDQLDIFVGAGSNSYLFPNELDTTVDPQFAGVIHYRRSLACNQNIRSTDASFHFLSEEIASPALMAAVDNAISEAIGTLLEKDSLLREFKERSALQVSGLPKSLLLEYEGDCPLEWTRCSLTAMSRTVTFLHLDNLDGGALLYHLYRYGRAIEQFIVDVIEGDIKAQYVGLESVEAPFSITISGVPTGIVMGPAEIRYFSASTKTFLGGSAADPSIQVYEVVVNEQKIEENRRRLQNGEALQIQGMIKGSQAAFLTGNDFSNAMQAAFREERESFITALTLGALRPSEIIESEGFFYFAAVSGAAGRVDVGTSIVASSLGDEGSTTNTLTIAIGVGVAGLFLLLTSLYLLVRQQRKKANYRKEVDAYREERRTIEKIIRLKEKEKRRIIGLADYDKLKRNTDTSDDNSTDEDIYIHPLQQENSDSVKPILPQASTKRSNDLQTHMSRRNPSKKEERIPEKNDHASVCRSAAAPSLEQALKALPARQARLDSRSLGPPSPASPTLIDTRSLSGIKRNSALSKANKETLKELSTLDKTNKALPEQRSPTDSRSLKSHSPLYRQAPDAHPLTKPAPNTLGKKSKAAKRTMHPEPHASGSPDVLTEGTISPLDQALRSLPQRKRRPDSRSLGQEEQIHPRPVGSRSSAEPKHGCAPERASSFHGNVCGTRGPSFLPGTATKNRSETRLLNTESRTAGKTLDGRNLDAQNSPATPQERFLQVTLHRSQLQEDSAAINLTPPMSPYCRGQRRPRSDTNPDTDSTHAQRSRSRSIEDAKYTFGNRGSRTPSKAMPKPSDQGVGQTLKKDSGQNLPKERHVPPRARSFEGPTTKSRQDAPANRRVPPRSRSHDV